jgi:hypothetical protein
MMEFESLSDLLLAIYEEIKDYNSSMAIDIVPISTSFYQSLEKRMNLDPEKIPRLMEILVNAKMIFSFPLTQDDGSDSAPRGFVLTRGDIISIVQKRQNGLLEKLYTDTTGKKASAQSLAADYADLKGKYNGTPLGMAVQTVMTLPHYKSLLERNIFKYSDKNIQKLFEDELAKAPSLSSFMKPQSKKTAAPVEKNHPAALKTDTIPSIFDTGESRIKDSARYEEFTSYINKNPLEKTLRMYGIEFYSRVCFREYRFAHIHKLVTDGKIAEKKDLLAIKVLLEKVRQNSDNDLRLNEFAGEINALMKCINDMIKNAD